MSELPRELLEEILCRVPTASLTRLRSTCKRWNRLFNDSRFARKHFYKSEKQSLILMLKKFSVCSILRINLHNFPPVELIGELPLIHRSSLGPILIHQVSHCNGLLLCEAVGRLVVWNPCTGQTRWITKRFEQDITYALGSYQDKKFKDRISYKILSQHMYYGDRQKLKIYEINSNSWRILDVTTDFSMIGELKWGRSLKGKTYWIARYEKDLVSFDYTTERFERLCLPHQLYPIHHDHVCLSVVREEKLSLLFQRDPTLETEIWVTNKIGDETKVVSWSMVFAVDLGPQIVTWYGGSFWIDEEKKVLVCCDSKYKIYIVGEDNKVRTQDLEFRSPTLLSYVPSLIQIGGRRERGK